MGLPGDCDLEISYDAPDTVRAGLSRLGRIEDLSFSPDNSRLALVGYDRSSIAIIDVDITFADDHPRVKLTAMVELRSPHLHAPHGIAFLDNETIVVASRLGTVTLFRVAAAGSLSDTVLTPIELPPGFGFDGLIEPGSVAITADAQGRREVLVCNNGGDTVTSHALDGESFRVGTSGVLLRRWLGTPDGIAVSSDNRWVAVSNHQSHTVMLYERSRLLHEHSDPDGILRGTLSPHGLHFSADDRHLFVADASRPYLHVYTRDGQTWRGVHQPAASFHVIDDESFQIGLNIGPDHGGPKGVAIDRLGRLLAMSSVATPVTFFDVCTLLERGAERRPDPTQMVNHELQLHEEAQEGRGAQVRVATLSGSYSFRVTRPLRYLRRTWSTRRRAYGRSERDQPAASDGERPL